MRSPSDAPCPSDSFALQPEGSSALMLASTVPAAAHASPANVRREIPSELMVPSFNRWRVSAEKRDASIERRLHP